MIIIGIFIDPAAVLPPISTKGLTPADVDSLTRDTRERMLKTLEELAQDDGAQAITAQRQEPKAEVKKEL